MNDYARSGTIEVVPKGDVPNAAPASAPRFRVQKIAPTPFFADYGCHVRIYEEAHALTRLGNQVTICTYPTGRDLDGMSIVRPPHLGRSPVRVGSSRHKYYLDVLLTMSSLQTAARRPGYHPRPPTRRSADRPGSQSSDTSAVGVRFSGQSDQRNGRPRIPSGRHAAARRVPLAGAHDQPPRQRDHHQ